MSYGCVPFELRRQQVTLSHYGAVKPRPVGSQLCQLRHDEESHETLICFTSVCLGEGLLGNFDSTFRGRPAETEGSGGGGGGGGGWRGGGGGLEWPSENGTNTQPIEAKIHRHTSWLPVNTHKSSSSSWNSTMRQLWVPAEPDSPTHWASLRQTHTLVPSHADQKHPTLQKPHTLFANRTSHSSEFTQKWKTKLHSVPIVYLFWGQVRGEKMYRLTSANQTWRSENLIK